MTYARDMDIMKGTAEIIKEKAVLYGADYAGIAGVRRFAFVPKQERPELALPKCRTVIAFGVKGCTADRRARLAGLSVALADFIRQEYSAAAVVTTPGVPSVRELKAADGKAFFFSQRRAAVAAGLGDIGWTGRVINPECGPRAVWGSILTDMELPEDPMYKGPKLCNPASCRICSEACPEGLIPAGRPRYTHTYDGIMQLDEGTTGLECSQLFNVADRSFITAEIDTGRCTNCCRCIEACPVGR